jgi:hypothetical protein
LKLNKTNPEWRLQAQYVECGDSCDESVFLPVENISTQNDVVPTTYIPGTSGGKDGKGEESCSNGCRTQGSSTYRHETIEPAKF